MTRFAEQLIDDVLPITPVRQWVLTVPHRLRYRMAYDHAICREVHRAFTRALQTSYRHRARDRGIARGQTGAVTCIQRFGSALNLNPHFHTQVLDGVFSEHEGGTLKFHPLPAPTHDEALSVLHEVIARLQPILVRCGIVSGAGDHDFDHDLGHDALAQDAPTLASVYAGSVQGLSALGERRGRAPIAVGQDSRAQWLDKPLRHHARFEGFDLHASVSVPAHARDRLEQLLRYCARPALSHDRLQLCEGGRVMLTLKSPRFDGTSHLILTNSELIERLIALIPRPHKNLILYTGVLAPNSKLRARVTAFGRPPPTPSTTECRPSPTRTPRAGPDAPTREAGGSNECTRRAYNSEWARLMRRAFDLDVLCCPKCSSRMRVLALIDRPRTAARILRHLGMRDHPPPIAPSRASDLPFDDVA